MFWDLRAVGLINQVLQPIGHPDEMGMDLAELPAKLDSLPYYPDLFAAAFGDPNIDLDRIAEGLAQFLLSIRSYQSRYDAGLTNGFADFTASELIGKGCFLEETLAATSATAASISFRPRPLSMVWRWIMEQQGMRGLAPLQGTLRMTVVLKRSHSET